jgi:hypothetical protein
MLRKQAEEDAAEAEKLRAVRETRRRTNIVHKIENDIHRGMVEGCIAVRVQFPKREDVLTALEILASAGWVA